MAISRFHSLLRERVNEAVENRANSLAEGVAKDYPHYRFEAGVIQGLRDALKIASEIESEDQ